MSKDRNSSKLRRSKEYGPGKEKKLLQKLKTEKKRSRIGKIIMSRRRE